MRMAHADMIPRRVDSVNVYMNQVLTRWFAQAPAKLLAIDPAAALGMPGVVAWVGAEDIPGGNMCPFTAPGQEQLLV